LVKILFQRHLVQSAPPKEIHERYELPIIRSPIPNILSTFKVLIDK
jgi:hypothetical protein